MGRGQDKGEEENRVRRRKDGEGRARERKRVRGKGNGQGMGWWGGDTERIVQGQIFLRKKYIERDTEWKRKESGEFLNANILSLILRILYSLG